MERLKAKEQCYLRLPCAYLKTFSNGLKKKKSENENGQIYKGENLFLFFFFCEISNFEKVFDGHPDTSKGLLTRDNILLKVPYKLYHEGATTSVFGFE